MNKISMPLKGFVEEARKTNRIMQAQIEERQRMQNNQDGIIDVSEKRSLDQSDLEKIKPAAQTSNTSQFNYINKENKNNEITDKNTEDYSISKPKITPKTDFEKEYFSKNKFVNTQRREIPLGNGTGLGKNEQNNSKQKVESKHGNIIANVIRQSGNNTGMRVKWDECKFLKKDGENTYCREYHCFCKKDACPFSCR